LTNSSRPEDISALSMLEASASYPNVRRARGARDLDRGGAGGACLHSGVAGRSPFLPALRKCRSSESCDSETCGSIHFVDSRWNWESEVLRRIVVGFGAERADGLR
jgi:hypothetical protein